MTTNDPTNNDPNKSSFGIFNTDSLHHKLLIPTNSVVFGCCILTGAVIFWKICHELIFNSNGTGIVYKLKKFGAPNDKVKYLIPVCISILVFGLYIIQTIALEATYDNPIHSTLSAKSYVSLGFCGLAIFLSTFGIVKGDNWALFAVFVCIIVYYVVTCATITEMVRDKSTFCKNEYISNLKVPMFFIIMGILILIVLLMSLIGSFTGKSYNCDKEFKKLKECMEKCVTKHKIESATIDTFLKTTIKEIEEELKNAIVDANKKTSETNSASCYKHIISVILIYIILILLGFNSVILALRPELFIAIIVIQRLWFGSSYAEDKIENGGPKDPGAEIKHTRTGKNNGTYVSAAKGDTIRRKSWDIIGMPIVRWLMYISRIDTDAHRHKILFGETNRKVFSVWESKLSDATKKEYPRLAGIGTKLTGIGSIGTSMKKGLMGIRVDKTNPKEHDPMIDTPPKPNDTTAPTAPNKIKDI